MVQLYGGTGQRQIKNICGEESTAAVIGQTATSSTARTNGGHIVRGNIVLVVMVISSKSSLSPKLRLGVDFVFPLSQEKQQQEQQETRQFATKGDDDQICNRRKLGKEDPTDDADGT